MEGRAITWLSIKKIPPYAGTAALATLIGRRLFSTVPAKFDVIAANPQETGATVPGSSETLRGTSTNFNFDLFRVDGRYLTKDLE